MAATRTGTSLAPVSARQMVNRLTMNQRIGLVAAFVITVGGLLFMSQMGGSGPMALLFSDLDASAAASAISELEARGVPYELTEGGSAIRVPADEVLELRVALASSGAVDSDEGWELLDNQGLTASDFTQRTGYQRALEGELARTISVIDGISSAKVHLVMPKDDLFTGDDIMPTASVLLQTGGTNLSSSQIRAIVNLVSNSVEGLTADMVSITDERGRPLASPGAGITGAGGDAAMEMQAAYENKLESELTQMLSAVAGPGNAVASVTAQLDFNASQVVTETYNKLEEGEVAPIERESKRTERYRGDGAELDAGVLGPEDEIIEGEETGTGQGVQYDLDEADIEYVNDKTITTTDTGPGAIRSLSVAVIVDSDAVDSGLQGELESVVAAAVGFDPDRGDTLALSFQPFSEEFQSPDTLAFAEEEVVEEGGLSSLLPLIRMGVIGLIALAATVLTALFGLRGRQAKVISLDPNELTSDEDLQAIGAAAVAALGAGEGGRTEPADLIALIESQPDDVAGMLRSWMAEDGAEATGPGAETAATGAGR